MHDIDTSGGCGAIVGARTMRILGICYAMGCRCSWACTRIWWPNCHVSDPVVLLHHKVLQLVQLPLDKLVLLQDAGRGTDNVIVLAVLNIPPAVGIQKVHHLYIMPVMSW